MGVSSLTQASAKKLKLEKSDNAPRMQSLPTQSFTGQALMQRLKEELGLQHLIGETPVFLAQIQQIPVVAQSDVAVLILGETGTGKELCARAIHYLSSRTHKPFVPVNCGAIPVDLVENELFGHERGAFTDASTAQGGLLQEAQGGTLFLDEIDSLPPLAQVKLLRFLQDHTYRPLGSAKTQQADVRVIAATNSDLEEAIRHGKFRQDLYYRLNIIPFILPSLRERREDIPLLSRHFLAKYAAEFNKPLSDFSAEAMRILVLYDWPGNVRELEHIVERAVLLCHHPVVLQSDIALPPSREGASTCLDSFQEAKAKVIAHFERTYLEKLLSAYQGNITKAAGAAQKNRRAFWQLLRKHKIDVYDFKSRT